MDKIRYSVVTWHQVVWRGQGRASSVEFTQVLLLSSLNIFMISTHENISNFVMHINLRSIIDLSIGDLDIFM